MAKKQQSPDRVLNFVAWFTGVVVSLVVGAAMTGIDPTLTLPWWLGGEHPAGVWVTKIVGWIVIITTLASAVLAVLNVRK